MKNNLWRNGTLYKEFQNKKTKKIIKVIKEIDHHHGVYFSSLEKSSDDRFCFASSSYLYKNYKPINE